MVIRAHEQGAAWTIATSSVRVVEDVLASLRFVHADDVRIWWCHDWRAEKVYIADAAAALEIRDQGGRHAAARRDPGDVNLAVTGSANIVSSQGGP
jgi:hypothetical protein